MCGYISKFLDTPYYNITLSLNNLHNNILWTNIIIHHTL